MFSKFKTYTSFSAPDIAAIKEFYTQKLGLSIVQDMGDNGVSFQTGGDTSFLVYIKPNHVAAEFTVLNFMVDDIEASVDELISKGVTMEQYDFPGLKTNEKGIADQMGGDENGRMAWFKDPAGNIISVGTF